jgi:hypothetical protein
MMGKSANLQVFCKPQKGPAKYRTAFARQRSLVRSQHRPLITFFHFQIERQQERNLEDLPLFRRTLTLPDDILAHLRNGLRVRGRDLILAQ